MSQKTKMGVYGRKGGKGGAGKASRAAVEAPNTLQSRATARVIDVISHGECIGLANRTDILKSIYYDGLPIKNNDGSLNWQGIDVQERVGLPGQDSFVGFDEVEEETSINLEITQMWPRTVRVTDVSIDALRVKIRIPALTKQNKENGDMNGTSVAYRFDVRLVDGSWSAVAIEYLNAKCTTPQELSYRIERPTAAIGLPWEMRVSRITPDTEDVSVQNKTWLASVTQLIDAKLQYADMAAVAALADSEQFGDSIPQRAFDFVGMVLDVPSNYTPPDYNDPLNQAHRKYTGLWNGTFKRAWTDNPAWVLWGLLTNREWGLGDVISTEHVDKWELYQIAKYCDEFVEDGFGGWEPRYRINTQITKAESAYATLQAVASIFRGMLYWGSGTVCFVCDYPKDPVKLVSPANVLDGEFSYTSTALKTRHTAARVTWNDPTDNFTQAIEVVEDPEMIDRYGYRAADITAYGCISRGEANRMGRWLLDTERYENETVTYRASFDHADVRPGQIVEIYDPHYAGARMGGRVKTVTTTSATLDAPVTIEAGQTYELTLVRPDGTLVSKTLTNTPGAATVLTWSGSIATLPPVGAITIFATACATQHSSIVSVGANSVTFTQDLYIDPQYTYIIGFTLSNGTVVTRQILGSNIADAVANDGKLRTFSWSTPLSTLPSVDSTAFLYAPEEGYDTRTVTSRTATSATISSSYTFREGYDYEAIITYSDGTTALRKLTNTAGTSLTLTWLGATNELPIAGSMWGLTSTSLSPRQFRVLAVKEIEQNVFEISALLYDRNKYDRVENGLLIDPPTATQWTSTAVPEPATGIEAYRRPVIINGVMTEKIQVFWVPSASPLVTHYRVGYRFNDGEFVRLTDAYNSSFEIDSKGVGDYTFIITAVNVAGKESRGAVKTLSLEGRSLDSPEIINLRTAGVASSGTSFSGPDLSITWDVKVPENWWGQLPVGADTTINSWEDPYFKDFVVKVQKSDGTDLKTFYTRDRRFTLDRATNALIGDNSGMPRRSLKISVAMRDVENVTHGFTTATFTNAPPAAPGPLTLADSLGAVTITVPQSTDYDYAQTYVWVSTTSGFDPLATVPTYKANQTQFVFNGEYQTTYYVRAAHLDTFSTSVDEASISAQFSITTDVIPLPDFGQIADDILADAQTLVNNALDDLEDAVQAAQGTANTAASDLILLDTELNNRIDGIQSANALKNRTFFQDSAPTNPSGGLALVAGDLWIDSDDNNKLYRWSGAAWNNTTAATGVVTYVAATAPTSPNTGDLWFDSANNMQIKRWSGTAWVDASDARISAVQSTLLTHASTLTDLQNNKAEGSVVTALESKVNVKNRTFRQSAAPTNPAGGFALVAGDTWINTTAGQNNAESVWSGSAWLDVTDPRIAAATTGISTINAKIGTISGTVADALAGKAEASELTTLRSEVETARNGSANLGAQLSSMRQTVTDGLAGKASATEFSTLKSEVEAARNGSANLNAQLTSMRQTVTDGLAEKASATDLSTLQSEITAARNGSANLNAQLTSMRQTVTDGLAGKASTTVVNELTSKVNVLDATRLQEIVGGSLANNTANFTSMLTGTPASVGDMTMTNVSSVTDAAEGPVLRVNGNTRHIWTKAWIDIGQGRTHRIRARVKVSTDGANANRSQIGLRLTNAAGLNGGQVSTNIVHAAADGWITIELVRTSEQLKAVSADSTHFRVGGYVNVITTGTAWSGATTDIAWVKYEDITETQTLNASLSTLQTTVTDGLAQKASATDLSTLQAEVNTARNGSANLGAQLSSMRQAVTDGLAQKASVTDYNELRAIAHVRPNLCPNGGGEQGHLVMRNSGQLNSYVDATWGPVITHTATGNGNWTIEFPVFDVREGETYVISGDTSYTHTGATGNSYLDIIFLNASNSIVLDGPQKNINGPHSFDNAPERLQAHAVVATAPAGAVKAYARAVFTAMVSPTFMGVRRVKVEAGALPATAFTSETTDAILGAGYRTVSTAVADLEANKASASAVTQLQARLDSAPNLIVNGDFEFNDETGWLFPANVTYGYNPDLGGGLAYYAVVDTAARYVHTPAANINSGYAGGYSASIRLHNGISSGFVQVRVVMYSDTAGTVTIASTPWVSVAAGSNILYQLDNFSKPATAKTARILVAINPSAVTGWIAIKGAKIEAGATATVYNSAATVTTIQQTSATKSELNAKYGVILDVNGKISGYQISSSTNSSTFDVVADKFRITNGSVTAAPFEVSGGVVRIKAANMGTVSAGNITVGTLTQAMTVGSGGKIIIDGANNRILISD